jgi:hypothetical protein
MTGALIADIAAGTYEKDKKLFFSKLICDNVKLSPLGNCLQTNGSLLVKNPHIAKEVFKRIVKDSYFEKSEANALIYVIAIAWVYDTIDEIEEIGTIVCQLNDKADWYAWHFLAKLIFALRTGSPKKRAAQVEHIGTFRSFTKDNHWKCDSRLLGTLVRAWMAFYDSFDYGSALHNAMKLPGDRHLNAIIVGALADAMYGCDMYLVKKKYGETSHLNIEKMIDKDIIESCRSKRTFFPKNNAYTNVERHLWTDVQTPYDNKEISEELRQRILKAFTTSWDDRFGFYLDDGWIYIYRSYCLLYRFRLDKHKDYRWVMRSFQRSGEKPDISLTPIENAIYSVEHRWYLISGEKAPKNLEYCKYYHGEPEMPEQIKGDKPISNFWHGEMMFVTNHIDMDSWKQDAATTLKKFDGDKRQKFLSYSEEQRAIIVYIETLFGKWCPYDNLEWIFEY